MQLSLLDISLEYCAVWKYTARAVSLTDEILSERDIEVYIASWRMYPSKGGAFELIVNGELLFSKKALGRHAEPGEIRALVLRKLEEIQAAGP